MAGKLKVSITTTGVGQLHLQIQGDHSNAGPYINVVFIADEIEVDDARLAPEEGSECPHVFGESFHGERGLMRCCSRCGIVQSLVSET